MYIPTYFLLGEFYKFVKKSIKGISIHCANTLNGVIIFMYIYHFFQRFPLFLTKTTAQDILFKKIFFFIFLTNKIKHAYYVLHESFLS